MIHKSLQLILEYPCVPANSVHHGKKLSWEDCVDIHRKLVDEYNSIVDRYKEYKGESKIDISNKKYKKISYMY